MALSDSAGIGSALPSQVGVTSGYVLQTDGATPSWVAASAASLPSQATHSGEFLTTNGTVASWTAVTAATILPTQTGHSGEYLTTNGTVASWGASPGGVTTLAAVGGTPNADGATISGGNTLTLEPANATNPGVVLVGNQTLGGGVKALDGSNSAFNFTRLGTVALQLAYFGDNFGGLYGYPDAAADPSTLLGANCLIGSSFSGTTYLGCGAAGTHVVILVGGTARVDVGAATLDATGLGNGGSIKLKSPDGTTYTATIANGGTWNIA